MSFVSVTQQFNTTTSMGRLTLNVLLSFAQFEREVTSERIRDKIAASKRKGLWVGGMAPLGYDTKDRRIIVVEEEAERVRTIFRSYLALGSLNRVLADLRQRGIVTKLRTLKTGRTVGGIPFTRGPLAYLLRNRFYIGEVVFKGEVFPGEQPAILDRDLFDAVQAKLSEQLNNHTAARAKSESPLIGRIYDDRGNRMSPSHARKQGIRYRYYVSSPLLQGHPGNAGSVRRVPAAEVEALVGQAVRERLKGLAPAEDKDLIRTHVLRVDVQADHLVIELRAAKRNRLSKTGCHRATRAASWRPTALSSVCPGRNRRQNGGAKSSCPNRQRHRTLARSALRRAPRLLHRSRAAAVGLMRSLPAPSLSSRLLRAKQCSIRQVNMTISLAFLAPRLVQAAVEGRLPRGIGVTRLRDAPAEWSRQYAMLGLSV